VVYAVWRKVGSKKRDQRLIEMALEMESETAKELEDFKTKVLSNSIMSLVLPDSFALSPVKVVCR